ncbi:hypothetical protein K7432_013231 [Basidiobolus ranarum]|uniref:Uncharacterized protein n=1 Tax=Basidiobolus ranarum TaxID=34480 RepID=A0ABR2VR31_9FUNG
MESLQVGDMFYIFGHQERVLSCNEADEIYFVDTSNTVLHEQLLILCGNMKEKNSFYLTFKYKKGFLGTNEEGKLINGLPFYNRGTFTIESFQQALGQQFTVRTEAVSN